MKNSKLIWMMIIAIVLIAVMTFTLFGCDLFNGGDNGGDDVIDDGGNGGSSGGGGKKKKTDYDDDWIDYDDSESGGSGGKGGSGQNYVTKGPYEFIATLLGGTKTTQEDGDYRVFSFHVDLVTRSDGDTQFTKKRFLFRSNTNVNGGDDSQIVVKLIDLTAVTAAAPQAQISYKDDDGNTIFMGLSVTKEDIIAQQNYEELGTLDWAFYVVNDRLFMETNAPTQPLLYFEDFDMDYVGAIASTFINSLRDGNYDGKLNGDLFKMLDSLIASTGLDLNVNSILALLRSFIFPSSAIGVPVTDKAGNVQTTYTLEIGINNLIDTLGGLVGLVMGFVSLDFDLQLSPIIDFLNEITPFMTVNIVGTTFKAKGSTKEITQSVKLEAYNAYYQQVNITEYAAGVQYYVLKSGKYEQAPSKYNKSNTYYIKEYKVTEATELEQGVTYYKKTSVGNYVEATEIAINNDTEYFAYDSDLEEYVPTTTFVIPTNTVAKVTYYKQNKDGDYVEATEIKPDKDTKYYARDAKLLDSDLLAATIYSNESFDLKLSPKINTKDFEFFSITNICLTLDIFFGTDGALDVGSVINSVAGSTILPEGTIIANAKTGLRINLMLDLDLNYGKDVYIDENGKERLVDNNYLVLEIFLIEKNEYGELILVDDDLTDDEDPEPLISAYYLEGSVYLDVGKLLERYYSGSNIKIKLQGLPEIIQYLVDLVSGALDKVFVETLQWENWESWNDLWNSKYDKQLVSAAEENSNVAEDSGIDVIALRYNEEKKRHEVSPKLVDFLKAVGSVVGLSDIFSTNDEYSAINITVNNVLINAIKALAKDLDFNLPDGLLAVLSINKDPFDGSISSIDVVANLDSRAGFKDKSGNWYVGTKVLFKPVLYSHDGVNIFTNTALTSPFVEIKPDKAKNIKGDLLEDHSIAYVHEGKIYAYYDSTKVEYVKADITAFAENTTYYTFSTNTAAYDSKKEYFIYKSAEKAYVLAEITDGKFAEGTTYYLCTKATGDYDALKTYYTFNNAKKAYTKEVQIQLGPNNLEYAYNLECTPLGIKTSDFTNVPAGAVVCAYIMKGTDGDYQWVVGYGLDEPGTDHIFPDADHKLKANGLSAVVSIHDMLFCYDAKHLFEKNEEANPYIGWVGNVKTIKGYILSKTHTRERVYLSPASTGTYYVYDRTEETFTEKHLGEGEGYDEYDPEAEYYSLVEKPYVSTISEWINTLLEGTFFSVNLSIAFSKGRYNLAPLISIFLPAMADKDLIWEFTGDFILDASLNLGVSLNKDDPTKSRVVLELVANKDIIIGDSYPGANDGKLLFAKGKTILGVYGVGNTVYAELENVKLLNITLPNLSLELDYTTLIYNLLGSDEIYDLTFDIYQLLIEKELEKEETTVVSAEEVVSSEEMITPANIDKQFGTFDIKDAIALYIDRNVVAATLSISAIQSLITMIAGEPKEGEEESAILKKLKETDFTDIIELTIALVLNRQSGVYLNIDGALLPKWDPISESYKCEKNEEDMLHIGLRLATDEEEGYVREMNLTEAQYNEGVANEVKYYVFDATTSSYVEYTGAFDATKKYYTYGVAYVATPVQIGGVEALLAGYNTKFNNLATSTSAYYDDLMQAILAIIGDLSLTIRIDASVLNSVWDINKIIDTIVADRADSFALPINVMFDEWTTYVELCVQWYLDLDNFKNTQIRVEIKYEGKTWIGLYIYNNSIVLDLNGLGLFDVEIKNLKVISSLGTVINTLMNSFGDLSLTNLINGLVDDALNGDSSSDTGEDEEGEESTKPASTGDEKDSEKQETEEEKAERLAAEEKQQNLIATILSCISIQNTRIALNVAADVFESIFRQFVGFSMYLEFEIGATVDIQEGELVLGVDVERSVHARIQLNIANGERGAYKFTDLDLTKIPDWNMITGEMLIKSILNNLELGLYIDLNQNTSTNGGSTYTRIYIEKLKANKSLDNTDGAKASKGSILVTLASLDEAAFLSTGKGTVTPLVYLELDYNSGKLNLTICSGLLVVIVDIGNIVGTQAIDLNLVNMLSGTLDGLIDTLNGLVNNLVKPTENSTSTLLDELAAALGGDTNNKKEATVTSIEDTIKATEVLSQYEFNNNIALPENVGRYYFYEYNDADEFYVIEEDGTKTRISESTSYRNSAFKGIPQEDDKTKSLIQLTSDSTDNSNNYYVKLPLASSENTDTIYSVGLQDAEGETYYKYYICKEIIVTEQIEGTEDTKKVKKYVYYEIELVSGISGMFENLDIIALFDMLNLYLSCDKDTKVGILNADIELNTYHLNSLIDHLMYYLFGPETILNLQEMTKDSKDIKFNGNYLSQVYWDRQNANEFWNDLWSVVRENLIPDLLSGLGYGWASGLASAAIGTQEGTVKGLISRLLPFAVTNESHLGLNLVRGQLTNIYLTNDDKNENVQGYVLSYDTYKSNVTYYARSGNGYIDAGDVSETYARGKYYVYKAYTFNNGEKAISYNQGRSNSYFTNLYIFNTSPSVGLQDYTGYDGAITWANTPSTITYNPYMYADDAAAAKYYYEEYFSGSRTATYQKATNLYKADLTFAFGSDCGSTIKNTAVTQSKLATLLATPGEYTIVATASFTTSIVKTLNIKVVVQSENEIVSIDRQELFVYQDMPAYIFMNVAGESTARRVDTSLLKFASTDGGKIRYKAAPTSGTPDPNETYYSYNELTNEYVEESSVTSLSTKQYYVELWEVTPIFGYECGVTEDGNWEQILFVKFPNGVVTKMPVLYKNSTIKNVILENTKNNVVSVNLYEFDAGETLGSYTPKYLYFTYYDGTAGKLKVDYWDYDHEGNNVEELFSRVDSTSSNYGDRSGGVYELYAYVATGTPIEQKVTLTFDVKSKNVSSVAFGSRTDTLEVQPYEYYLYLSDKEKYAELNPYQDVITVNYDDNNSEKVAVTWSNINSVNYNWSIEGTETSYATVGLNVDYYASKGIFAWTKNDIAVTVSRNQIAGIYFDELTEEQEEDLDSIDLKKTTLEINPYDYYNAKDKYSYFRVNKGEAYVRFTNGKTIKLPIAWSNSDIDSLDVRYAADYTQFTATIGFDVSKYKADGTRTGYFGASQNDDPFLQSYTINVKVVGSAIEGILCDGSELSRLANSTSVHVIDPIEVNFNGKAAFDSQVWVKYIDGSSALMDVLDWIYDFKIYMNKQSNLTAICRLTKDGLNDFEVKVEILDRSASMMTADLSGITSSPLNPYAYSYKDDGKTLTYDVFEDEIDLSYVTEYKLVLEAAEAKGKYKLGDAVVTKTFDSNAELSEYIDSIRHLYTTSTDTYSWTYDEKEAPITCNLVMTTTQETAKFSVYWDTSSLSGSVGTSTVKYYVGHDIKYAQIASDAVFDTNEEYYVLYKAKSQTVKNDVYAMADITEFADGVKYYTISNYELVDQSTTVCNPNKTYYFKSTTYVETGAIKGFIANVDYYTRSGQVYTKYTGSFDKDKTYYYKTVKFEGTSIESFDPTKEYYVNYYELEQSVDVEFTERTVKQIGDSDFVYIINVDSETYRPNENLLSNDEIASGITKTLAVYFSAKEYIYMDTTIKLSTAKDEHGITYNTDDLFTAAGTTKYTFTDTTSSVSAVATTYYVLGKYTSVYLYGNGTDDNTKTYYKFETADIDDMHDGDVFYVLENGYYVPVTIHIDSVDPSINNISSKRTYYSRTYVPYANITAGTHYVLNADASNRDDYVEIKDLTDSDARYDTGSTYYTLTISQYYYVEATIEADKPELAQTALIKVYILA